MPRIDKITELSILYEISSMPVRLHNLNKLTETAVDKAVRLLGNDGAAFYLYDSQTEMLTPSAARGIPLSFLLSVNLRALEPDFNTSISLNKPFQRKVNSKDNDHIRLVKKPYNPSYVFVAPIVAGDEFSGFLYVIRFHDEAFDLTDEHMLKSLTNRVAIGFENRLILQKKEEALEELKVERNKLNTLYKKLNAANNEMKQDLKLAKKLQSAMLPANLPQSPKYKIYGYYNPIEDLGGDLYDVFRISEHKTAFFILDVVGHGVSAALVTAMAKMLFYNKSKEKISASAIVEAVNREITPITSETFTYFSLFFGIINSKDQTLEYVNASHPEPYIITKDGSVSFLISSSLYIGLREDVLYNQQTISLKASTRLILFTDGFYEMQGSSKERFGEKRLLDILIKYYSSPPEEVVEHLNQAIALFQGEEPLGENDDRAMVIIDFF